MASPEQVTFDNSAQQKRIDSIAARIASISNLYGLAESPAHISKKIAERKSLTTSTLPEDVGSNIRHTTLRLAVNEEAELYAKEFPGHEPPEFLANHLLKK
jgi:hypothetical protein